MSTTHTPAAGDEPVERRKTPTERLHEALMQSLERPTKAPEPSFSVAREKGHASGPAASPTVWTFTAHVPRCDEYPTAELAFEAALAYAGRFEAAFPTPTGNGPAPLTGEAVRGIRAERKASSK